MNLGSDVVITITGIVLVFAILVLLMLIIMLEGKDLRRYGRQEEGSQGACCSQGCRKACCPPYSRLLPPLWWRKASPGDVVAAIMAAIHAMGNGKYTLKAVRRAANGWSKAGVNDTTAPF